jgi:cell division protein FtsQ
LFEVGQDLDTNRRPFDTALSADVRDFPGHVQQSQPRRGRKRWFLLKLAVCLFVALTGAAAYNILTGTPVMQVMAWSQPGLDHWARWAGFGIDTVTLRGHKFTTDTEIFDALDLQAARSIASFDTEGVRRRLERLPWIETAEITRVYPGRLDVLVSERKAFAVWRRGNDTVLVDRAGRVLTAVHRTDGLGLPVIAGEGAATAAEALYSDLSHHPALLAKVSFAERVGGRRWTLHLANDVTVHMAADGEASALPDLDAGGRLAGVVNNGQVIIDLRAPGRTAVRPAPFNAGNS